jgi:hypothetical protein
MGGSVCGTDIAYDAQYLGQSMSVSGFVTAGQSKGDEVHEVILAQHRAVCGPPEFTGLTSGEGDSRPVELEVRDIVERGVSQRRIRGSIGEMEEISEQTGGRNPPGHSVDLRFNREQLSGDVALRRYDMHRVGDNLVGHFTMYGKKVPYIVYGADELWSMPAPVQAAILPLLLTCTEETRMIQRIDLRN